MYCLDTNAVIAAINQRQPHVAQRLQAALAGGAVIGLPAIVLYEIRYGISKSARPEKNQAILDTFLTLSITPWAFDDEDAAEAGDIRAALERAGTPIGPYDVLIAAQARRRKAVLVTANMAEFARVPGLRVEDWSVG
jgi:tRNA(fMet)-specific endonuclease VapC